VSNSVGLVSGLAAVAQAETTRTIRPTSTQATIDFGSVLIIW